MNTAVEKKELEIGKDYGFAFGLNKDAGQSLVYNGDNEWIGTQGEQSQTLSCEKTSEKALTYINKGK
jgi:hypothetical protein